MERFQLERYLYVKWGRMVVFRGTDLQDSHSVVVKIVIEPSGQEYGEFINEHTLLTSALADCPGVPKVLSRGSASCTRKEDAPAQVQVLVQRPLGRPLYEHDKLLRDLDPDTRRREVLAMASALHAILSNIHERGVIHRDLKPDNIVRDDNTGELTIIDFGMSVMSGVAQEQALGTRAYCAPCIVCQGCPATFETDFISLLYTALALEYGCGAWLDDEDRRDDDWGGGPCARFLPDESAASFLLDKYLGGEPSFEKRRKCWDRWHLKVADQAETEKTEREENQTRSFRKRRWMIQMEDEAILKEAVESPKAQEEARIKVKEAEETLKAQEQARIEIALEDEARVKEAEETLQAQQFAMIEMEAARLQAQQDLEANSLIARREQAARLKADSREAMEGHDASYSRGTKVVLMLAAGLAAAGLGIIFWRRRR